MTKGIEVKFKSGKVDWYDPCDEIIIDNGANQYKLKVDEIESLNTYEIPHEDELEADGN